MPEMSAAALRTILARIEQAGIKAARTATIELADAIAKQAKTNASNGRHTWGTPTPARPDEGPAQISGTLRNSITREAVTRSSSGWETKVGMRPGRYPLYNSRTPSSRYALYLETGLKNGTKFPFLEPATRIAGIQATVTFTKAFNGIDWGSSGAAD